MYSRRFPSRKTSFTAYRFVDSCVARTQPGATACGGISTGRILEARILGRFVADARRHNLCNLRKQSIRNHPPGGDSAESTHHPWTSHHIDMCGLCSGIFAVLQFVPKALGWICSAKRPVATHCIGVGAKHHLASSRFGSPYGSPNSSCLGSQFSGRCLRWRLAGSYARERNCFVDLTSVVIFQDLPISLHGCQRVSSLTR